jgi:hypothetical protein
MCKVYLFLTLLMAMGGVLPDALADVAPYPRPRPIPRPKPIPPPIVRPTEPPIAFLDRDTKIELNGAQVQVSLSRAASVIPRLGRPPLLREQEVVADVEAAFELKCQASKISPAHFTMAFPVAPDNRREIRRAQCTRFSVTLDKQQPSWTRSRRFQLGDTWFDGYIWPASIREGATQKVAVNYRLRLPVVDQSATFTYVLRSGAEWSGLIGQETIRVESGDGLTLRPRKGGALRPSEESDQKVVWNLKGTDPNEDILVDVRVP